MTELLDARSPEAEAAWRSLEERADPPYFLSWGWIDAWLRCLTPAETPRLLVVRDGDQPVAACFLGRRRTRHHHLLPSETLFLNTTGIASRDELCIEHNRILHDPAWRPSLADLITALPDDWDELALDALDRDAFPGCALDEALPDHVVRIDREVQSPYVSLARVRAAPGGYLSLLAANTRSQIRRAQRGLGPLTVEVAADPGAAFAIYGELVDLHRVRWRERGEPGAFADPWFDAFHRMLIARRFDRGEIQLLRVRAGAVTVGCLYNFVHRGRVLFYQSGLAHFDDPHLKPGYVAHVEAIRIAAEAGHAVYDLLGGAARYKRSLATDETTLVWARLQRRRLRFAIEERLRALRARTARIGLRVPA